MKTLSKEAEALILDAIRDVVTKVADGQTPTDAVVKVAEERTLPAGFVPMVCRAYNIGRQTQQRNDHEDILGKTAEFPLADADAALALLYPNEILSPAEKSAQTAIDPAYSKAPSKPLIKAASGGLWATVEVPAYPRDPSDEARRAVSARQLTAHLRNEARLKVAHTREQFLKKIAQLRTYFTAPAWDRIGWADFQKNAQLLYPETAQRILRHIDQLNHMTKRARHEIRDRFQTQELFDRTATPYVLLEGCLKAAHAVSVAQQECDDLTPVKQAAAPPPPPPEVERDVLGLPIGKEEPSHKEGGFLEFALGSGVGKGVSDILSGAAAKPTSALVQDKALELEDPSHDAALRQIQAQAMVSDFIANDPVISGFDPDDTMAAYNEISQVSPRAATQPALMRPLLRKRLSAGGLEPFEANEMANLEKTLGSASAGPMMQPQGVLDGKHPIIG